MNKNGKLFKLLLPTFAFFFTAFANAAIIVSDFETDLSAWTGKISEGGAHSGLIVQDPLDPSNKVLTFTQVTGAGDVFTVDTVSSPNGIYTVSFDYLGMPGQGTPGDLGGYFGISLGLPGDHYWVAGTGSYPTPIALIDDGTWHHYELTFSAPAHWGSSPVHFMLEDWDGSGPVAGDIFFDNLVFGDSVEVEQHFDVSEPNSLSIFGMMMAGLLVVARRRLV